MALMPPANSDTRYVVCEGQADAVLLGRLLIPPFRHEDVRVLAADGAATAVSLARTLLVTKVARVAVVLDADLGTPFRGEVEAALAAVAPRSRWGVFIFAPSAEALLASQAAASIAEALGRPLSEAERGEAAADPARLLKAAAATAQTSYPGFIAQVARHVDAAQVRHHPVLRGLFEFLGSDASAVLKHVG